MRWVSKPGTQANEQDRPRLLTTLEIEGIAAQVPRPTAASDEIADQMRVNIVAWVERELGQVEFAPSKIPDLTKTVQRYFSRAQMVPQTPIGLVVACTIGSTNTQMTLNTFHQSGTAKTMSSGISAVKELLLTRRKRKIPLTITAMRDRSLGFAGVLSKRASVVASIIKSFVVNHDIETPANLTRYWWHDNYPFLIRPTSKTLPAASYVLRLYLNIDKLYAYQITMDQLARTLENEVPSAVMCAHSPISGEEVKEGANLVRRAIMDIYPIEHLIRDTVSSYGSLNPDMAAKTFLECFALASLADIRVKGISGISALHPLNTKLTTIMRSESKLETAAINELISDGVWPAEYAAHAGRIWKIGLKVGVMMTSCITLDQIVKLLSTLGISIIAAYPDNTYLVVVCPTDDKPLAYITKALADETRSRAEQRQPGEKEEPGPLEQLNTTYSVQLEGANLYDVMAHPDLDPDYSISNNIHDVAEVLGIEAARAMYAHELFNTIANSEAYIDPRLILMVADMVCSRGVPLGATYSSMARQPHGAISLATVERAMTVLRDSAAFSKAESMKSVSAAIIAGQLPAIGTGGIETVGMTDSELSAFTKRMGITSHEQGTVTVPLPDPESFAAAIDEIDRLSTQARVLDQTAGIDEVDMDRVFNQEGVVLPDITGIEPTMPQPIVPKPASPKPPTVSQANTTVLRIKPKNEVPIQLVQALDALNKPNPTYPDGQPIVIKPLRGGLKVELSEPAVGVSPVQVQSLTVPRAEGGLPPVIARAIGPVSPVTTAIKPLTPVFTPTAPAVTLIKPLAPVVTPISPVVTPAPAPAPAIRLALPVKAVQPVGPTPLAAQPVRVAQPIGVAPQAKATALPSLASFQLQPAPIGLGEQQVQPIDVAAFLQALGRG